MAHKWVTLRPKAELSKLTLKRFKKGPKELLKGVRWGEFMTAANNDLLIEGELFKFRIGNFFHTLACGIIYERRYMVLRKVSTKGWDKYTRQLYLPSSGQLTPDHPARTVKKDDELSGNWWYGPPIRGLSGLPHGGFVLMKSKFDLLR